MTADSAVETSDLVFKIVVSGPTGAGKSTFISTIAAQSLRDGPGPSGSGDSTDGDDSAVGMDFATYVVPDPSGDVELRLYGMPGEERFRFMWELLAEGADGIVMIVDGRDTDAWQEALKQIAVLRAVDAAPGVIIVNRQPDAATLAEANRCFSDTGLQVVGCEVTDEDQAVDALLHVLAAALEQIEAAGRATQEAEAWL